MVVGSGEVGEQGNDSDADADRLGIFSNIPVAIGGAGKECGGDQVTCCNVAHLPPVGLVHLLWEDHRDCVLPTIPRGEEVPPTSRLSVLPHSKVQRGSQTRLCKSEFLPVPAN